MTTAHTTNEKDPRVTSTGPFENHPSNDLDYPTGHRPGKASAALKAQFARAGHLVHDGGNDDYIVVKADWCMSRHCRDYAALIGFGRQLGVL